MNKKGAEIALNTVVIAIIAVLVVVVVIFIFLNNLHNTTVALGDCEKLYQGKCAVECGNALYGTQDLKTPYKTIECENSTLGDQICCIK